MQHFIFFLAIFAGASINKQIMSYRIIAPATCDTTINLPASKSISNRILVLNGLCNSNYPIENISDCNDTRVMLRAFNGKGDRTIDINAAGTAMRFLTAYYSLTPGNYVLTGSERMKNRPISVLVDALRYLGAHIAYTEKEGYPPLNISGQKLTGGKLSLKGSISSQYISALLMIAPYTQNGIELTLTGEIISRPYINMTLQLMKLFGAVSQWKENRISVPAGNYEPLPFTVEADWSAASYWYEVATFIPATHIVLPGLTKDSLQGDSRISEYFEPLGVRTSFSKNGVVLTKTVAKKNKIEYDLTDQPDLAQTLVVTCAMMNIPFRFTGLQSLRIKETDRISALQNELKKLGYIIEDENDSVLEWNGERITPETNPKIRTYEDHRMAMAFAPAAYFFPELGIENPEVVEKSYPHFWKDLAKAGITKKSEK